MTNKGAADRVGLALKFRGGGGLEGGDGFAQHLFHPLTVEFNAFCSFRALGGVVGLVFFPLLDEDLFERALVWGREELLLGGKRLVVLVEGDLFDRFSRGWSELVRGEIGLGDLQAVEQDPGRREVEHAVRDLVENPGQGLLERGAVFERGDNKRTGEGVAWNAGTAGGMVVVTEGLAAQGG